MNFDTRAISVSLIILATIAVFYVLVVGKAFLVPLALAVMLWYVINALSRAYAKLIPGINSNWITTLASLLSIGLFIMLAIEMVQNNVADVSAAAPEYKKNFALLTAELSEKYKLNTLIDVQKILDGIEVVPIVSGLAASFQSVVSYLFLVPIYVLFLMLEQKTFQNKIIALFPNPDRRESVSSILSHAQEDIQTYLWIKTLTSTTTGLLSYAVLWWVDVDFAGFWAFTIFLLNYIPTIGSIIATLFPAVLALIQFNTPQEFVIVLVAVGAIQLVVGNFLEPKLMGNSLNLSPFVVMLSLTLWGSIWGISGMFLSVPITVMLLIVFAHFGSTRSLAILLSGDGNLKFADVETPLEGAPVNDTSAEVELSTLAEANASADKEPGPSTD